MLSGPRARRLLAAYLVAGLGCSLTVGTMIVVVLQGYRTSTMSVLGGAVLDVVLGAAACGYAAGVWTRRRSEPSRDDRAHRILTQRRLKNLKVTGATLIGVITRLTGLLPVPVGRILRRRAAAVPGAGAVKQPGRDPQGAGLSG